MAKDPKADVAVEAGEAAPKSKKKLMIILLAVLLLAGGGGAAAWFMMHKKSGEHEKEEVKKVEPAKAPVFITLETFTINLQPDPDEKFLQLDMQLQVASMEEVELLKLQMPVVRNRLLLLLTSKRASEILTTEGKNQLIEEITAEMKKPFTPNGKPQEILGVFFTSFVVQ